MVHLCETEGISRHNPQYTKSGVSFKIALLINNFCLSDDFVQLKNIYAGVVSETAASLQLYDRYSYDVWLGCDMYEIMQLNYGWTRLQMVFKIKH